mmetsp:Transcript_9598/g.29674  ORF Transcript_9598/g.29674 Transcript_9598/m.29674 type:complete len:350 (-) Transcript_9598:237-1286(-)
MPRRALSNTASPAVGLVANKLSIASASLSAMWTRRFISAPMRGRRAPAVAAGGLGRLRTPHHDSVPKSIAPSPSPRNLRAMRVAEELVPSSATVSSRVSTPMVRSIKPDSLISRPASDALKRTLASWAQRQHAVCRTALSTVRARAWVEVASGPLATMPGRSMQSRHGASSFVMTSSSMRSVTISALVAARAASIAAFTSCVTRSSATWTGGTNAVGRACPGAHDRHSIGSVASVGSCAGPRRRLTLIAIRVHVFTSRGSTGKPNRRSSSVLLPTLSSPTHTMHGYPRRSWSMRPCCPDASSAWKSGTLSAASWKSPSARAASAYAWILGHGVSVSKLMTSRVSGDVGR